MSSGDSVSQHVVCPCDRSARLATAAAAIDAQSVVRSDKDTGQRPTIVRTCCAAGRWQRASSRVVRCTFTQAIVRYIDRVDKLSLSSYVSRRGPARTVRLQSQCLYRAAAVHVVVLFQWCLSVVLVCIKFRAAVVTCRACCACRRRHRVRIIAAVAIHSATIMAVG